MICPFQNHPFDPSFRLLGLWPLLSAKVVGGVWGERALTSLYESALSTRIGSRGVQRGLLVWPPIHERTKVLL